MKILVTGGAGFIGSHLVDKLIKKNQKVIVVDNLSQGKIQNIENHFELKNFEFIKEDFSSNKIDKFLTDVDIVYHVAAYPEVRTGFDNPRLAFNENILKTFELLEKIRKFKIKKLVFTSSSVVYGDADIIPTPEEYSPLQPVSMYGSTKLACENLISSYSNMYNIKATILRFANVIGKRSNHGIIWDFIHKVKNNKNKLEILGDGKQIKSYIHVDDCINGIILAEEKSNNLINIFNIGNEDWINSLDIGKIVCDSLNLNHNIIEFVGGTSDGRGWIGDIKKMRLDIKKIRDYGWTPNYNSVEAVKKTSKELINEIYEK